MIEQVDFREVWPSPMAEAAACAFEWALCERLAEAWAVQRRPEDRERVLALKTTLRQAWDDRALVHYTAKALALHRGRSLNPAHTRRLAWALVSFGRFEEAVPLFSRVEQDDHLRWFDQTRALAGSGRLAEAAEAAERSAERLAAAPPEAETQARALARLIAQRPSGLDIAAGWGGLASNLSPRFRTGQGHAATADLRDFLGRRANLLVEAVQAASASGARNWADLRRQAGASLLLGLDALAAERLLAAAGSGIRIPLATDDGAVLFAAAAAATPETLQPMLLQTLAGLVKSEEARAFAELALATIHRQAEPSDLLAAPRPAAAMARAIATMLAQAGRPEPAVGLLGDQATGKRRGVPRQELAVCQSRETIARLAFRTIKRNGRRRVFDLFPYNGELEVLNIKLHEMSPWIDRFVLVESAMTFSGQPQPLRFDEAARAELGPFLDKIVHVVIDRFPEHVSAPWAREFHQRDQAAEALGGLCGPDDLVILSDVDEVADGRVLEGFDGELALLEMAFFRYFLNHRRAGAPDARTFVCRGRYLEDWGASLLRILIAPRPWVPRIERAGWHFSSAGGVEAIARKLASYSHQEHNRPDNAARFGRILERLQSGELDTGWERCGLDALPAFVAENRDRLKPLLL